MVYMWNFQAFRAGGQWTASLTDPLAWQPPRQSYLRGFDLEGSTGIATSDPQHNHMHRPEHRKGVWGTGSLCLARATLWSCLSVACAMSQYSLLREVADLFMDLFIFFKFSAFVTLHFLSVFYTGVALFVGTWLHGTQCSWFLSSGWNVISGGREPAGLTMLCQIKKTHPVQFTPEAFKADMTTQGS